MIGRCQTDPGRGLGDRGLSRKNLSDISGFTKYFSLSSSDSITDDKASTYDICFCVINIIYSKCLGAARLLSLLFIDFSQSNASLSLDDKEVSDFRKYICIILSEQPPWAEDSHYLYLESPNFRCMQSVDMMKPGNILRNAKIDMFKGSMRLAVDKWGRI